MRLFSREATQYAALLVILFAIAAMAVWHTLSFLSDRVTQDDYVILAISICAITFGFMMIAGAFGLWAIQFAAREEARRRVSQLVDAMEFLSDGLLAVDSRHRITGANPAARAMSESALAPGTSLGDAFQCLNSTDVVDLISADEAAELERPTTTDQGSRTLRFRALPADGLTLLLLSDVTSLEAKRESTRQAARLQLIGEIARGVAHDFNNLLCTISGYASLLKRHPPGSEDFEGSIQAITQGVERGTALAGHLIELTRPLSDTAFMPMTTHNIEAAVTLLKESLPAEWSIDSRIQDLPPIALSGIRIEQIIYNLGMLAVDAAAGSTTISVWAGPPSEDHHILNVETTHGGVILITAAQLSGESVSRPSQTDDRDAGVIISVLRSMISQSNGQLDILRDAVGNPIFRICLARSANLSPNVKEEMFAAELGPYFANWSVLLAADTGELAQVEQRMMDLSINVERVHTLASLLSTIERGATLDALVIQRDVIMEETGGILKAIIKLCPAAAVVVLSQSPQEDDRHLKQDVSLLALDASVDRILLSLVEAKALAVRRHQSGDAESTS